MAIDLCHEQKNAIVKGFVGAIGMTGNLGALRHWMVAGPETEMETSSISCPMKIRQHPQLCQVEENFGLGLKLICFAEWSQICLKTRAFPRLMQLF